jgi:hypothetical protein
MATIIGQEVSKAAGGGFIVSTEVRLEGAGSENVEVPRLSVDDSNTTSVAQLVRPGDTAVTVTKTDKDTVAVSAGSGGLKVLLVSHSANPIGNPA